MSVRQRRAPVQFNFNKQHGYIMFKVLYSRMIQNLQFSGMYQDILYIQSLLKDPDFGLVENIMPMMMGDISKILKLSKGYLYTPTLTE